MVGLGLLWMLASAWAGPEEVAARARAGTVRLEVRRQPRADALVDLLEGWGRAPMARLPIQEEDGSAFAVGDGRLLTSRHVVAGALEVVAILPDGRRTTARVEASDPERDVAVLRLAGEGASPLALADSDALRQGAWLMAVGFPFGDEVTVTTGVLSRRGMHGVVGSQAREYLVTDARINPGNSGGPVLDAQGRVVGMVTAAHAVGSTREGLSFLLPAKELVPFVDAPPPASAAWLGLVGHGVVGVDGDLARRGVVIDRVDPDGPAGRAGLAAGQVLTTVDGLPVGDVAALGRALRAAGPGRAVLGVNHDHVERAVPVTLAAERPWGGDGQVWRGVLLGCDGPPTVRGVTPEATVLGLGPGDALLGTAEASWVDCSGPTGLGDGAAVIRIARGDRELSAIALP